MLGQQSQPEVIKLTWINIDKIGKSTSGKTDLYIVHTKEGGILGSIKWYGAWRKYVFAPASDTIYEPTCLQEIAIFLNDITLLHRLQKTTATAP